MNFGKSLYAHPCLLVWCGLVAASATGEAASVVHVESPDGKSALTLTARDSGADFVAQLARSSSHAIELP